MPPPNPQRKSAPAPHAKSGLDLNPAQQKKLKALFVKLNEAIDHGHAAQALTKLNELSRRLPNEVNIHLAIGRAEATLGRHPDAIAAYKRAAELMPKSPEIRYKYGVALHKGGMYEEALVEFERVLYLDPDHFYALRHKSSVITDLGRTEDGYKVWLELVEKYKDADLDDDKRTAIAISGARYAPKLLDAKESIENIQAHIELSNEKPFKKAGYFQLGRLYNHLKMYDEAFEAYGKSKHVEKAQWDPEDHSKRVDQLIDCWRTDEPIPYSNASGIDGSRLIFIVGMMRSGTSLTEQMLAQVKGIVPGGEMNSIGRSLPKTEVISMKHGSRLPLDRSLYTQGRINKMSKQAMEMYNEVHRHYTVTDKQPYNYTCVPLIMHMFPGAKIISCLRDPLDCCLSNFTQAFARLHPQTHELYYLGRYYADYERTMKAWREIPEVDMIDLQYEELVSDPETQSKRVMEFLGREWTDDILEFHKSKRTVNTASRDQVRKPMYTSSVKKYLPYEHLLDDLKRGIEEGRARPHGG